MGGLFPRDQQVRQTVWTCKDDGSESGKFFIRIHDAAHGAPHKGYLTCSSEAGRNDNSAYVYVTPEDVGCNRWTFESDPADNTKWFIRLAEQDGVPFPGGYLSASESEEGDRRGDDSSFIYVNASDEGVNRWVFEGV